MSNNKTVRPKLNLNLVKESVRSLLPSPASEDRPDKNAPTNRGEGDSCTCSPTLPK